MISPAKPTQDKTPSPPRSILLVDDDEMSLFVNRVVVRRTFPDATVSQLLSAGDALEQLLDPGQTLPDLLIMDVNMPVMDAWDFMEALSGAERDLSGMKLYFLTAEVQPSDQARIEKYDLQDAMRVKPLSEAMLAEMAY
ncbi:response regulator [Robiginitalea biformata]|uniref:response regulator n=1 Tax=Robiginitalea biformata TaxID=252307 RepID=UPI003B5C7F8F